MSRYRVVFCGAIEPPRPLLEPALSEALAALTRCRIVARTGVGVDRIDLAAADERGIYVTNAAGCNAIEVAEHTIGLLLALARKIVRMNAYVHAGRWQRHSAELHAYRGRVRRGGGPRRAVPGAGRRPSRRRRTRRDRARADQPRSPAADARQRADHRAHC